MRTWRPTHPPAAASSSSRWWQRSFFSVPFSAHHPSWTTWTPCRRRSPATCWSPATGSRRASMASAYLEKPPLKYWLIAISFRIFGVHDWAARIPIALAAVLLCWVTAQFGTWAFGCANRNIRRIVPRHVHWFVSVHARSDSGRAADAGRHARAMVAACARSMTPNRIPGRWAMLMWASMGTGLLLKGLIALVFPIGAGAAVSC